MYGIGYAWAAQFARGASLFENMGLSDEGVSIAFLAGPICGLVVQPIVGTLSDQTTTRCGRRRPWIVAGLGLVVASFLVIGDSYAIGGALGDHRAFRPRGLVVAISAFWVLDFSQNAVQLPCRTLVSDVLVPSGVATGNSMFALFDGLGKLTSYLLAATTLDLGRRRKSEPDWVADTRAQFAIAALVAAVCVGYTAAVVSEPQPVDASADAEAAAPPHKKKRTVREAVSHAWALAFAVLVKPANPGRKHSYELVSVRSDADVGSARSPPPPSSRRRPDEASRPDAVHRGPSNGVRAVELAADAAFAEWTAPRARRHDYADDDDDDDALFSSSTTKKTALSNNNPFHENGASRHARTKNGTANGADNDDDDDSAWQRKQRGAEEDHPGTTTTTNGDDDDADDDDGHRAVARGVDLSVLRRMCFTELGLWFGLSAWQVWGALLVGKAICGGRPAAEVDGDPDEDADAARFTQGTLLFSLGLAGSNLVSLALAPVYPALLRTVGARRLMTFSALAMAVLMTALAALPFALRRHTSYDVDVDADSYDLLVSRDQRFVLTVLLLTLLGIPWAAHMNIPWIVVGRAYQDAEDLGLFVATLNTSLCVAQLVMGAVTPLLIQVADGSVTACFAAGGVAGLFAAYHANKLEIPYDETDRAAVPSEAACGH